MVCSRVHCYSDNLHYGHLLFVQDLFSVFSLSWRFCCWLSYYFCSACQSIYTVQKRICIAVGTPINIGIHFFFSSSDILSVFFSCFSIEEIQFINNNELIEKLINKIMSIQDKKNPTLKVLKKQLSQTNKAIENIVAAIEQGIITKLTKARLD